MSVPTAPSRSPSQTSSTTPPPTLATTQHLPSTSREVPSHPSQHSHPRRPQISHSNTISTLPDSRKRHKRPTPSFLSSFFATFTPTSTGTSSSAPSPGLKTHRSEVELRRSDYLSPEREKEIGEIWEIFKRHHSSRDEDENQLTSFPCIVEYEYECGEYEGQDMDHDDEHTNRREYRPRRALKT